MQNYALSGVYGLELRSLIDPFVIPTDFESEMGTARREGIAPCLSTTSETA